MTRPELLPVERFPLLTFQKYERYLPTAFDESLSLLEKVNKIIYNMNKLGELTNEMVERWNQFYEWVLGKGLEEAISDKLEEWLEDGTLEDILTNDVLSNFATLDDIDVDKKVFKKEIYKTLPIKFPYYDEILSDSPSVDYFYPQSFCIDYTNNEIFVLFAPNYGGVTSQRWIVVYNYETSAYKSCFGAGNAGGEAIVVKEEDSHRFLYVKESAQTVGRYLIDVLPVEKSVIYPQQTFNVGMDETFSYRNGTWVFEQTGATLGGERRRSSFSYYDDTFTLRGTFKISPFDGGLFNSAYAETTPKRQGIALGDNFIYQSTGAAYRIGDTLKPNQYQGVVKFDKSGEIVESGLVDPNAYIDWYTEAGLQVDRIEQEGIFVDPNGEIISLTVHLGLDHTSAHLEGITLVKEYSNSRDKKDLSASAKTTSKFNYLDVEGGVFPRSGDGDMYNPLTGEAFETLEDILFFLKETDTRGFSFYTTSVNVSDINGDLFPGSTLVRIYNSNNVTFFVDCYKNPDCIRYCVYEDDGVYTQVRLNTEPDTGWVDITTSLTPSESRPPRARRQGDHVNIEGIINGLTEELTAGLVLGTIDDAKLRPTKEQWFPCYVQGDLIVRVDVKTDGEISIGSMPEGVSTSDYICLDGISYIGHYY